MFKKVKRKILVINILIISILLFVAMTAIYLFTLKTIYSEIKKDVEQVHYEWNEIDEMLKKSNNEAIGDRLAEALIKTEELGSLPWTLRISVLAKIDNKTGERNIYSVHDNDPDILDYAISKTDISDGDIVFFRHKDKEWAGYKQNLKESTKYIFIDTTSRMIYLKELMITSGIIFSATLVIVFLISIYLTNRAVQPVDLAFKKQIQFISDASHELRTPLASIRANADLILKRKKNQLGVDVKWLEYIKDETKRMTALTNEMLYLAELEDKYRLNDARRRFDIGKDINNHILGMEAMAYEKSITLKHNIDSRIDVYGNREKLNQVVIILMNNALKYTNEGGVIDVKCKRVKNYAVITIMNTGEGISPENTEKVFDRFFKLDVSRKDGVDSYGLGLSIAKAIINNHKGILNCDSSAEGPTIFTLQLKI